MISWIVCLKAHRSEMYTTLEILIITDNWSAVVPVLSKSLLSTNVLRIIAMIFQRNALG